MAKARHQQKPARVRRIALERIEHLFLQAEKAFKDKPLLSNRYVQLARKIAMKYKVSIRSPLKKRFCKHCHSYLKQGVNCTVRLSQKHLVYHCHECKKMMRFPYKK
ncbi:ribonuclease P [Candidatus Woesearchaeota archaeon]|nr:ribonuclease P [Candidatus Woesearchaeota archaeon]